MSYADEKYREATLRIQNQQLKELTRIANSMEALVNLKFGPLSPTYKDPTRNNILNGDA